MFVSKVMHMISTRAHVLLTFLVCLCTSGHRLHNHSVLVFDLAYMDAEPSACIQLQTSMSVRARSSAVSKRRSSMCDLRGSAKRPWRKLGVEDLDAVTD